MEKHSGWSHLSEHSVRREFKKVDPRKAAGPDSVAGRVLKTCAEQLAPVFTALFNLSLAQSIVPTRFKESTIIPIPKHQKPSCLNDYRPVALTSVAMKCFERLVKNHICSMLPSTLDPLQFAYRENRSTDDAISHILHTALSHLDIKKGKVLNYVRVLFIDYSSAFNTISPSILITKLRELGIDASLCSWILDFLTGRPQTVKVGNQSSETLILNTGAPQGCVLSPLLYSLYTHDCVAFFGSNCIVKFADDTALVARISNNDEAAYLEEVELLAAYCKRNKLKLNVSKTKEMLIDFGRTQERTYNDISIDGTPVERVDNFKYLGVLISRDLTWSTHLNSVAIKARQRLHHLRRLKRFRASPQVLQSFYRCAIESIMTGNITSWFGNSTKQDLKPLKRVVKAAERIVGKPLKTLNDIDASRCASKTKRILKDASHPGHKLFCKLSTQRKKKPLYRSLSAGGGRLFESFYPRAIRHLNDSAQN